MLLFVDLDAVVRSPAHGTGPADLLGLHGLEAVLVDWPALSLVITSERRHRATIDQLAAPLHRMHRRRIIGTTRLHGDLAGGHRSGAEDDILHWLHCAGLLHAPWLALDHRLDDFERHRDRVVACEGFTAATAARLNARLDAMGRQVGPCQAACPAGTVALHATPPRSADPRRFSTPRY